MLDEIPYLVLQAPELPSVLQHFVDHDAKRARLTLAIAGSSQRVMQGLVMDASAPLFGRARELLAMTPLPPAYVRDAFGSQELLEAWTAWGGIPRYWELARDERGAIAARIDRLVLDPLGPLHREPDPILLEEVPSALEVRPVLSSLVGEAWEQLCRDSVSRLGEWSIASRWWRGNDPEWDVVAESLDRSKPLLGEVKVRASQDDMENLVRRPAPPFAEGRTVVKALFAASPPRGRVRATGALLVGLRDVFARGASSR